MPCDNLDQRLTELKDQILTEQDKEKRGGFVKQYNLIREIQRNNLFIKLYNNERNKA